MASICFDPVAGASGDMILGALFDLGADPECVADAVRSAGISDFRLAFSRRSYGHGMQYGRCEVTASEAGPLRHLRDLLEAVARADIPQRAAERAKAIFQRLAEAEAEVHGIPVSDVHFHEIGAVDTVVDVLGTCVALEQLGADHLFCSALKIGRGTLTCSHGVLPVPAPATAKLIEGHTVCRLPVEGELTTPTGAAILTTLSEGEWHGLDLRLRGSGTGHGTREIDGMPNIIRAFLVETDVADERVEVIETDVDDESPEVLGALPELLREAGALDVVLASVYMKKGRPGTRLTVIVRVGEAAGVADVIFRNCSTIGVRVLAARRFVLPRCATKIETPWGPLRAKRIERPGGPEIVPEADACAELARRRGVPLRDVMAAARAAAGQSSPED